MKKYLIIVSIVAAGCGHYESKCKTTYKTVQDKNQAVNSHYNILTKRYRMDTEYFLVFTDGSYEEVDLGKYTITKPGDKYPIINCQSIWVEN